MIIARKNVFIISPPYYANSFTELPSWIVVVPLSIFTFFYMLKEGVLDYRRRKNDASVNEQQSLKGSFNKTLKDSQE